MYLRAVGGEVGATSSLAPKIGPLGLVRQTVTGVMQSSTSMNICAVTKEGG